MSKHEKLWRSEGENDELWRHNGMLCLKETFELDHVSESKSPHQIGGEGRYSRQREQQTKRQIGA